MGNLERPDPNSWAHIEKKDYAQNGRCTATFSQEKDCLNFLPFVSLLCSRRCGYNSNRCMPDPVDKAVELNEGSNVQQKTYTP